MSAEAWELHQSPELLADLLFDRPRRPRKRRLLLCGCCRLLLPAELAHLVGVVEAAEAVADGAAWRAARKQANAAIRAVGGRPASVALELLHRAHLRDVTHDWMRGTLWLIAHQVPGVSTAVVRLVRDVFGNPFRPVAFDPEWRTYSAAALARSMYDARDFAHMPVLADALEDAGCTDPQVIAHCRDPEGVHVRGCWVVDGVLGLS